MEAWWDVYVRSMEQVKRYSHTEDTGAGKTAGSHDEGVAGRIKERRPSKQCCWIRGWSGRNGTYDCEIGDDGMSRELFAACTVPEGAEQVSSSTHSTAKCADMSRFTFVVGSVVRLMHACSKAKALFL